MAWLAIITGLLTPILSAVSAMLKDTSVVLILLGCSLGFHFGDTYGRWRQAKADSVVVRNGTITPAPHRPIRDLIHSIVGDPPDGDEDNDN